MRNAQRWLAHIRDLSALVVFFLAGWWLRLYWGLSSDPYFLHFLITIPWALTLICWVLTGFGHWPRRSPDPLPDAGAEVNIFPWLIPWGLFIWWTFISGWWAAFPNPAWDAASQAVAVGLFAVVMATAAPPRAWIIGTLGMGAVLQAVIATLQTSLQNPVGLVILGEFEIRPDRSGLSVLKVNGQNWLRPYGLTAHPNILGGFLAAAALGLFAAFVVKGLSRRKILLIGIGFGITLWGLFLTFSRAAWGGVVVGGLIFVGLCAWRARDRIDWRRFRLALVGGVALTLIFVVTHQDLVFARAGLGDETGELRSVSDRALFTEYALRMIHDHPLFGLGAGMNAWAAAQMIVSDTRKIDMQAQPVHNLILLFWSETGLIGLVFWLASMIGAAWVVTRRRRDPLTYGLAAIGLALAAVGMLDYYMWNLFPPALLWCGIMGAAVCVREAPYIQNKIDGQ